jgi:hypothetical protein
MFSNKNKSFDSNMEHAVFNGELLSFEGCFRLASSAKVTQITGNKLILANGASVEAKNISVAELVVEAGATVIFENITAKNITFNGGKINGGTVSYIKLSMNEAAKLNAMLTEQPEVAVASAQL